MFHQGHLNILRAARERCDRLVVGVTSDEALIRMKGRAPVIPLKERCDLVSSLRFVDAVVVDLDQDKRLAWRLQPFDVLFKGASSICRTRRRRRRRSCAALSRLRTLVTRPRLTSPTRRRKGGNSEPPRGA